MGEKLASGSKRMYMKNNIMCCVRFTPGDPNFLSVLGFTEVLPSLVNLKTLFETPPELKRCLHHLISAHRDPNSIMMGCKTLLTDSMKGFR